MHLDKESALKPQRKKRRSSCLPCFLGSPVSDSDMAETPPAASAARFGRRRRQSGWFSCPRLGKKKTKNTVAIDAPAKAAAGTEATPAAEEKLSDEYPAAQQSGHEGKSSGREGQREQQTSSPQIPQTTSGPPSTNHRPVRTRSKSNDPNSKSREAASSSRSARIGAVGPLVGAAVMAVTLAILVFAGRITAVICLCSCLFITQVIRAPPSSSNGGEIASLAVDIDSDEYKQRVILEGFLERNGRRLAAVGFSAGPPTS